MPTPALTTREHAAGSPTIQVVVQQNRDHRQRSPRRRAATLSLAAGGAALLSAGVFSTWDATASVQSGQLSAGTGSATLLDANGGTFTTGVSDLLPGDYFYRYVDVQNGGSRASTFTGTVEVTGDLSGYMAVDVVTCSVPWTTTNGASTCSGTVSNPSIGRGTPTASTPVPVTHGSIGAGAANAQHARYTFTFDGSAPTSAQGKTGSIAISVTGTVVGGTNRTTG